MLPCHVLPPDVYLFSTSPMLAGVLYISAEVLDAAQQSTVVLTVPRDAQGELPRTAEAAARRRLGLWQYFDAVRSPPP